MTSEDQKIIVVAGATGNLGNRIVRHLLARNARVRALFRKGSNTSELTNFTGIIPEIVEVDYGDPTSLRLACEGAYCVVSALSGLRTVLIDAQTNLLHAAEAAGVKKFIPSDYCIEFTNLPMGQNRNLDLRREFSMTLEKSTMSVTSILNGMFSDLLLKEAPVVLFDKKRIFFWGDADQKMDFTTIENTAEYTAAVVFDPNSPRWLRIAGTVASMRDICHIASEVEGTPYKFLRPGGLGLFKIMIKVTKLVAPGRNEIFPAWQGMQYMYDMLSGIPKFSTIDNGRYKEIRWITLREVLSLRQ